ncbi:MAG: bifunctional phosphoribosylaminoimidazolecarboxamide formyltransferase/IMP cyclohydrolase, partial [Oligoflexia bacterium]|nr:bifunctional phosphoribosylaminoimidazolecarboxamide formyltransferase/IMP cyclohydrolase [Oligoflexia bacterium]
MEKIKVKNALISATNKELIAGLAKDLDKLGVRIYSTKGTAKFLARMAIESFPIEEYIGFPEILDGRVKTLHPRIFGGILARRELDSHIEQMKEHNIVGFDLVCVDLYAVEKAINESGNLETVIENIDIGGISLIRAAAKAYKDVAILTDPADFGTVIEEINSIGGISIQTRKTLSAKAFRLSSMYDNLISNFLFDKKSSADTIELSPVMDLRYGENPHQEATYYKLNNRSTYIKEAIKGDISYNNLLDLEGAVDLCFGLKSMSYPYVAVIVKHGSPSGVGVSDIDIYDAFNKAWDCDPRSSFGGVLALSTDVNTGFLSLLVGKFIEVISSTSF